MDIYTEATAEIKGGPAYEAPVIERPAALDFELVPPKKPVKK